MSHFGVRTGVRSRQRTDHEAGAGWQLAETFADEMAQPAAYPVADNRAADGPGYDKTGARRRRRRCLRQVCGR